MRGCSRGSRKQRDRRDRRGRSVRFEIEPQEFQEQLAVSRRHRKPQCPDMINRVLPPRVLSFEREGNFDLSDGKNVHAQPCKQLFERSEERRVGKECRSGWSAAHEKEIMKMKMIA